MGVLVEAFATPENLIRQTALEEIAGELAQPLLCLGSCATVGILFNFRKRDKGFDDFAPRFTRDRRHVHTGLHGNKPTPDKLLLYSIKFPKVYLLTRGKHKTIVAIVRPQTDNPLNGQRERLCKYVKCGGSFHLVNDYSLLRGSFAQIKNGQAVRCQVFAIKIVRCAPVLHETIDILRRPSGVIGIATDGHLFLRWTRV